MGWTYSKRFGPVRYTRALRAPRRSQPASAAQVRLGWASMKTTFALCGLVVCVAGTILFPPLAALPGAAVAIWFATRRRKG